MQTENQIDERITYLTNLLWIENTPDEKFRDIIQEIRILQKIIKKD